MKKKNLIDEIRDFIDEVLEDIVEVERFKVDPKNANRAASNVIVVVEYVIDEPGWCDGASATRARRA